MAEGGLDKHRIRMSDRRPVCIYPDKVKDFGVEERRGEGGEYRWLEGGLRSQGNSPRCGRTEWGGSLRKRLMVRLCSIKTLKNRYSYM